MLTRRRNFGGCTAVPNNAMIDAKTKQIEMLEAEIAALKKQWPAHSVSPALLQRLDDLEDALAEAKASQGQDES